MLLTALIFKMEITVLASGSNGNCYRISDGSTPLIIECGILFKNIQIGLNFKTSEISGCLLTHCHSDHSKAVKDVLKAGIDVYTSQGTIDALGLSEHRLRVLKSKKQINIGTWTVLPFDTEHDAAEPLGFLLASRSADIKFLFATDTFYVRYKFQGLTHIAIECNYADDTLRENVDAGLIPTELKNRLLKSHFSLENVKEFLKANDMSKVREIHLIHLSETNADPERFRREIQQLTGKPTFIAGGE